MKRKPSTVLPKAGSANGVPPLSPGSVIRVTADALNPGGAKRMANLLKKHGIRPEHAKCPRCGGKVTATDSRTFRTPSTRYSITCDDDCEGVFAPSVRMLVKGWADLYSQNDKRSDAPEAHE